jgi:hypothetical protein
MKKALATEVIGFIGQFICKPLLETISNYTGKVSNCVPLVRVVVVIKRLVHNK